MALTIETGTLYVSAPLSNMAIDYGNSEFPLAMGRAFPHLPLPRQTGTYFTFDKNSFRVAADSSWAPGAKAKRINPYVGSTSTYTCERHKWEVAVTSEELAYADKVIKPRIRKTKKAKDTAMRELEIDMTTVLQDYTTTYSSYTGATSNGAWTTDSSTPKADVDAAKESIWSYTGVDPDKCKIIMGYSKFNDLKDHPAVKAKYQYTSSESITAEMLARYFEVKEIIVHKGVKNTAVEGQTDTMSAIWSATEVTVLYVPESPAIDEPSAGYLGNEVLYGKAGDCRVRNYPDPENSTEQELIELTKSWSILETANDAVYIITSC